MKRRIAMAAAALLVAATSLAAAAGGSPAKPVFRIDNAKATAERGKLVIEANGAVRTGGWENPRLRIERSKTSDEMIIVFVAIPPAPKSMVVQAILPVKAKVTVPMPAAAITEVRIAGETNSVVTKIVR
jgi:hypothetical protein